MQYKCPLCGKFASPSSFTIAVSSGHPLEQGQPRGRGQSWYTGVMPTQMISNIVGVIEVVLERLQGMVRPNRPTFKSRQPHQMARQYRAQPSLSTDREPQPGD